MQLLYVTEFSVAAAQDGDPAAGGTSPVESAVDGVPMMRLTGRAGNRRLESFVSNSTQYSVFFEFELKRGVPAQQQEELVDSVLATVDLAE